MSAEHWIQPNSQTILGPLDVRIAFDAPERPLAVDLGCGKGRFLLAMAERCPNVNFLGVDRMLGRLRKIERTLERTGWRHVRLLRMDLYYCVSYLLAPRSVHTCYVFFPDPWPKARHQWHRLFQPPFMDGLARVLIPGGTVHVATDHLPYLEQIHSIVMGDGRFELVPVFLPSDRERTDFELRFVHECPIGRLSFRLRGGA
jgi:tRNA (guanine-N7-)-methyltransferase